MSMEELKLIAETITQLGVAGKEAFIWWVVLENLPGFLLGAGFISSIFYVVNKIWMATSENQFFIEIRNSLDRNAWGQMTSRELIAVKNKIRQLVSESKSD